jgi:hypothetical protein
MSVLKWSEWLAASDEAGFSAIPAGDYDMYIESAEATQAQSSGKDMVKLVARVEAGPHEGAKIFSNLVVSPENPTALSFLIRKLAALGLDREYLAKNPSLEKIASDLEHRRFQGKVTVRQWNEQDRNDLDSFRPPADGNTHRASGSIPDTAFGVFMPTPGNGVTPHASHPSHPAHHGAGKGPELPF